MFSQHHPNQLSYLFFETFHNIQFCFNRKIHISFKIFMRFCMFFFWKRVIILPYDVFQFSLFGFFLKHKFHAAWKNINFLSFLVLLRLLFVPSYAPQNFFLNSSCFFFNFLILRQRWRCFVFYNSRLSNKILLTI